jgi:chromosome segregation ATPase
MLHTNGVHYTFQSDSTVMAVFTFYYFYFEKVDGVWTIKDAERSAHVYANPAEWLKNYDIAREGLKEVDVPENTIPAQIQFLEERMKELNVHHEQATRLLNTAAEEQVAIQKKRNELEKQIIDLKQRIAKPLNVLLS